MDKFKLITFIDRINYFSNKFIDYYSHIFDKDEFLFITYDRFLSEIKPYIISMGFDSNNIRVVSNKFTYGLGEKVNFQNHILNEYIKNNYIVVYCDIDELIYIKEFKNYVLKTEKKIICPKGLMIIQNKDELPLDTNNPILTQRSYCVFDNALSKVSILKKKYLWGKGRHMGYDKHLKADENCFIVDIGRSCKKIIIENNIETNKIYKSFNNHFRYLNTNIDKLNKNYNKTYYNRLSKIPKNIPIELL